MFGDMSLAEGDVMDQQLQQNIQRHYLTTICGLLAGYKHPNFRITLFKQKTRDDG